MSETTRREFIKDAALTGAAISAGGLGEGGLLAQTRRAGGAATGVAAAPRRVALKWLGEQPPQLNACLLYTSRCV